LTVTQEHCLGRLLQMNCVTFKLHIELLRVCNIQGMYIILCCFFVVNCVWKGIGVMESKRNNKSLGFFANIYGGVGHSAAWWPAGWVHH